MAYKYKSKLYANSVIHSMPENVFIETGETKEIKEVYRKAKAWDRMYDMIIDESMTIREFDDEVYELLKQTGKTDIRIITDPSIRMEDE